MSAIQTIGVIGSGTMGNGIAQACASSGFSVVMIDINEAALQKGLATIAGSFDRLIKKEKLTEAEKTAALARIQTSTQYEALKSAQLVIEAATENLELKIKILRQLDGMLPSDTLIASNTSSISITQLAAVTGRADIMAHFDRITMNDEDFIFQVGTLSGNPVASVAGLATLDILKRPGAYEQVFATGRTLMATLQDLLQRSGFKAQVIGEPPLFDILFTDQPIKDYRDTLKADAATLKRFNQLLRARGIMKGESKYYVSLAHTRADIDLTIAVWTDALKELKASN